MGSRRPKLPAAEIARLREAELWRARNARAWELVTNDKPVRLIPSPEDRRLFVRMIGDWTHS